MDRRRGKGKRGRIEKEGRRERSERVTNKQLDELTD